MPCSFAYALTPFGVHKKGKDSGSGESHAASAFFLDVVGLAGRGGLACRRKIEMSPGAQSRDDTAVGGGHDERDHSQTRGEGERHPELTGMLADFKHVTDGRHSWKRA